MDAWLTQWKPSDLSFTTLIAATFVMFWLKVWPWLTNEYFPARRKAEALRMELAEKRDARDATMMKELTETMIEIKTLVEQNTLNSPILQTILDRLIASPVKPRPAQKKAA